MYYPRFTKLIVNFFMSKDPSIPRRNKINWHYARDDPMFTIINVISRHEDTQLYGAILPKELTNEDIRNSESYKEKPPTDLKDKRVKQTGKMIGSRKQKQPATGDGVDVLSKVPDEQVHKKTGTDEGAGDKPEVPEYPNIILIVRKSLGPLVTVMMMKKMMMLTKIQYLDVHDDEDDDDANKDLDAHDDDDDDATESDDDGDN
ncbi:hypothetical protein Tco_0136218, partial [Tanacetum coccineum]